MADPRATRRRLELTSAQNVRRGHEDNWQEQYDLMQPMRGDIVTVREEGSERIRAVHDTTAAAAVGNLENFMMAMIFPSTDQWIRLHDIEGEDRVQRELDDVSFEAMTAVADSNFYTEIPVSISDLIVIGNTTMTGQEKPAIIVEPGNTFGGIGFKTIPMWRVWWVLDDDGLPLRIIREYEIHAVDAVRRFRDPGPAVREAMEKGNPLAKVSYFQWVYPNENGIPGGFRANTDKKYVSEWWAEDGSKLVLVREAGFDYMPFMTAGWTRVAGETYFRGLGHTARPDAKGLNELTRKLLNAIDWKLDPPFGMPDDQVLQFDFAPGGLVTLDTGPVSFPPNWIHHQGDTVGALDLKARQTAAIERIFLADVLAEPDTEARSAEAVIDRRARGLMRISSPSNHIAKLLTQVVEFTIGLMLRRGALPQLEEIMELRGGRFPFRIEFTTPFFTAQKESLRNNIRRHILEEHEMVRLTGDPRYAERINPDAVSEIRADLASVPREIYFTEEEVAEIRAAKEELVRRQIALAEQQQQAEIANTETQGQKALTS